jgi:hypothetical protein
MELTFEVADEVLQIDLNEFYSKSKLLLFLPIFELISLAFLVLVFFIIGP